MTITNFHRVNQRYTKNIQMKMMEKREKIQNLFRKFKI